MYKDVELYAECVVTGTWNEDDEVWEYPSRPNRYGSGGNWKILSSRFNIEEHEYKEESKYIQPVVRIPNNIPIEIEFGFEDTYEYKTGKGVAETTVTLPSKKINEQIGGHVFLDKPENKTGNIDGIKNIGTDTNYAGIQVQLWELNSTSDTAGTLVATTTTDKNGRYSFYGLVNGVPLINPLKKYYVTFTYNGQMYQSTYYKNDLTGGFSNAKDVEREAFNQKFENIYSDTSNYKISNNWRKAFALLEKLKNSNGDYIAYKGNDGDDALTYSDAWDKFIEFATNTRTYTSPTYADASKTWVSGTSKTNVTTWQNNSYGNVTAWHDYTYDNAFTKLNNWLVNTVKTSQDEANKVIQFIKDSMITATTRQGTTNVYPVYNRFVLENIDEKSTDYTSSTKKTIKVKNTYTYLYTKLSDQSRYVDYGITARVVNDLALQKDVYKATVIVNGKKEEYIYSKKDLDADGGWNIKVRSSDALYNGQTQYNREIRKSEYLYNGTDGYDNANNVKNLQVYVTYRIAVKNQGNVRAKINEIVDYYDDSAYEFDGTLSGNQYSIKSYNYSPTESKKYGQNGNTYVNSYVGSNAKGNILSGQGLTVKTIGIDNRTQETISGSNYSLKGLYLTGIKSSDGKDYLEPGKLAYVYLTFKVKNDANTNKVKMDQNLLTGEVTVGKRNIAEINGYSTQYTQNAKIPNSLVATTKDGKTTYTLKDTDVSGKAAGLIDTDSNPGSLTAKDLNSNGDIITDAKNSVKDRQQDDTDKAPNIKLIIDQTSDDTRVMSGYVFEDNRNVNSNSAIVGDGKDNNETKINGVTLELVELVQNVDENGIFTGTYSGEKVWETYTYNVDSNNKITLSGGQPSTVDYYSGYGSVSGQQAYQTILTGNGILEASIPDDLKRLTGNNAKGQYAFVSVPTGDFYIRFTYGEKDRTVLTSTNNEVNTKLNAKGMNEKSYNGQDFKSTVYQANLSQDTSYNGIAGFKDYNKQNYTQNYGQQSSSQMQVNDGTHKETMYYYDIAVGDTSTNVSDAKDILYYRKRANEYGNDQQNYKAEVLDSFEKLGTYNNGENQRELVSALENNTYQVAQTGIINMQVEYNKDSLTVAGNGTSTGQQYKLNNINLGLVERPRAQVELEKQVSNVRITLANGNTLFDATKSVNNLYYAQHTGHTEKYTNAAGNTNKDINNENATGGLRITGTKMSNNSATTPELIQAYIDDELMEGSTLNVEYRLTVKNVGDVDYLDNQFYYTGKTNNTNESNISRTNVVDIVDYVSNEIKYEAGLQNNGVQWKIKAQKELVNSVTSENPLTFGGSDIIERDLVNREYYNKLITYNTILTTNDLQKELLPITITNDINKTTDSTTLVLSTTISSNTVGGNNLVYNNLAEITHLTNSQGRRMQFSIVGNQSMANQNAGNDTREISNADLVTPTEIDADSAQKIILMPPTGENKNYIPVIIAIVAAAGLVIAGIILLNKKVLRK